MKYKAAMVLSLVIGLLLSSQLYDRRAEAKGFYHSDLGQTYAVFTMIAVAIAGFGILLAIYTRESIEIKHTKEDTRDTSSRLDF